MRLDTRIFIIGEANGILQTMLIREVHPTQKHNNKTPWPPLPKKQKQDMDNSLSKEQKPLDTSTDKRINNPYNKNMF